MPKHTSAVPCMTKGGFSCQKAKSAQIAVIPVRPRADMTPAKAA